MINSANKIQFSRWEQQEEENKWHYMNAYALCLSAKLKFETFFQEDLEWWGKWNVIELLPFNSGFCLNLVEYEMLGLHPFPKEIRRFHFNPFSDSLVELNIIIPTILHRSYELIPKTGLGKNENIANPRERKRWFVICEELYLDFDSYGLLSFPKAYTEIGFSELMAFKNLEIKNLPTLHNKYISIWRITQVVDENIIGSFGDL